MRKIKFFESEIPVEEWVKREICKNGGTDSIAFKSDLVNYAELIGVPGNEKMSKVELFELLLKHGCTYEQLASVFHVGVKSSDYQDTFGISHEDVKRLERHGVLKCVGKVKFRKFGKYMAAPLYDIYQFCRMTDEDMKDLMTKYPKGARIRKEKVNNEN